MKPRAYINERQKKWRQDNPRRVQQHRKNYRLRHPEKCKARNRAYYAKNSVRIKKNVKEWQRTHREKVRQSGRIRAKRIRAKYPEKDKASRRRHSPKRTVYVRERRRRDIQFRLKGNLRCRIYGMMRGTIKRGRSAELIGCTVESLLIYLESKFESGMTWSNYGTFWEIDHIIPCALFDLANPLHQRACFHFSNLQPMLISQNRSKQAKFFNTVTNALNA